MQATNFDFYGVNGRLLQAKFVRLPKPKVENGQTLSNQPMKGAIYPRSEPGTPQQKTNISNLKEVVLLHREVEKNS
jgi:hypothetical protein